MKLSKSTLVKIAAYNSTWLGGRGSKRFVQSSDGGAILIQQHPDLADTVITLFAIGKSNENVSAEQITRLSYCHPLFIVIPYDIMSPKLFSLLSLIRKHWEEKSRYVKSDGKKYILREGYQIDVVADVGKDLSTGEIRYASLPFDDEAALASTIKNLLFKQGGQTDPDPYSLPSEDMRIALKEFFSKTKTSGTTLRDINKYIKNAEKRRIKGKLHFEELTGEQQKSVVATVLDLFGKGLSPEEVKCKTIVNYNICGCEILNELIDDAMGIPKEEIKNWRKKSGYTSDKLKIPF
jgi:hypothetical protein